MQLPTRICSTRKLPDYAYMNQGSQVVAHRINGTLKWHNKTAGGCRGKGLLAVWNQQHVVSCSVSIEAVEVDGAVKCHYPYMLPLHSCKKENYSQEALPEGCRVIPCRLEPADGQMKPAACGRLFCPR